MTGHPTDEQVPAWVYDRIGDLLAERDRLYAEVQQLRQALETLREAS
jgi:hypothetical protein